MRRRPDRDYLGVDDIRDSAADDRIGPDEEPEQARVERHRRADRGHPDGGPGLAIRPVAERSRGGRQHERAERQRAACQHDPEELKPCQYLGRGGGNIYLLTGAGGSGLARRPKLNAPSVTWPSSLATILHRTV